MAGDDHQPRGEPRHHRRGRRSGGDPTVSLSSMNWSAGTVSGSGVLSVRIPLKIELARLNLHPSDRKTMGGHILTRSITGSGRSRMPYSWANRNDDNQPDRGVASFKQFWINHCQPGTLDIMGEQRPLGQLYLKNGSAAIIPWGSIPSLLQLVFSSSGTTIE